MRSAEDIEEEEREGGIRRPWLSQFEFIKLETLSTKDALSLRPQMLTSTVVQYFLNLLRKMPSFPLCSGGRKQRWVGGGGGGGENLDYDVALTSIYMYTVTE